MDASKIVVLVLSVVAIAFLVWIEINSRRNTRALKESGLKQPSAKSDG